MESWNIKLIIGNVRKTIAIITYKSKIVPFDPERTEESTMAAKQTKIPFDMMNNGMSWPEDNSEFEK